MISKKVAKRIGEGLGKGANFLDIYQEILKRHSQLRNSAKKKSEEGEVKNETVAKEEESIDRKVKLIWKK